jgi:hypothetical protein
MRIEIKNQNQIGESCILFGRREKKTKRNDLQRQFDHHTSSHDIPYGRGQVDTSKETAKG